ncbi:hypothetical protein COV11_04590 [Candidatus Woesearchaeota archaeon CG10_big_fil_rev_8_21_14_0_10_30_7]|nr:MAG: hypothetical protein COV11_04590 [Candidatus Woesearchaeota archaeon CG10_big_fil_rev_8_21_14_0_10_30_7]
MEDNGVASYIVGVCSGLAIGFLGGGFFGDYLYQPRQVQTLNVNSDDRPDIVVGVKSQKKYIFLQQEDGSYKRLDEVQSAKVDDVNSEFEELLKKAEKQE